MDREIDRQKGRWGDREIERQMNECIDGQKGRQTERQTERQTDTYMDGWIDREMRQAVYFRDEVKFWS
jgi:hypothetical protein